MPCEGMAASSDRDAVRRGEGAASSVPLRGMWSWRDWRRLAIALPVDTGLTAFTDGCPGPRLVSGDAGLGDAALGDAALGDGALGDAGLGDAGVTKPPILDWFHIAMRLQHATQAASVLSTDEPGRAQAKTVIVEEVECLRWRIWNGKAGNAERSIERIRKVTHVLKGERGHRTTGAPSRKLWHALHEVDRDLRSQSNRPEQPARTAGQNNRPEQPAGQRRQAIPRGPAGWNFAHRRHGELPRQSADEQVATDAMVATRSGSTASDPLCYRQRSVRVRIRRRI